MELLINDSVFKLENEKRNVILVPWVDIKRVFDVPDFYFAAKVDDMLNFSRKYLDLPEITDYIHTDIFYKWTLGSYCKISIIRIYLSFFSILGNNTLASVFINNKFSKGFFVPLDKKILQNIFWRGEKLQLNSNSFSDGEVDYSKVGRTTLGFVLKKIIKKIRATKEMSQ